MHFWQASLGGLQPRPSPFRVAPSVQRHGLAGLAGQAGSLWGRLRGSCSRVLSRVYPSGALQLDHHTSKLGLLISVHGPGTWVQ